MEREKTGRGRSNSNYKHVFARIDREIVDKFGIGFFYQPPGTVQTFNNCACLCRNEQTKKKEKKIVDTIFLLAISSTFSVYSVRFAVETDPAEDSWLSGGLWCHCHAIHHLERWWTTPRGRGRNRIFLRGKFLYAIFLFFLSCSIELHLHRASSTR